MSASEENFILCVCTYFIVLIGSVSNALSLSYFIRQTKSSPSTFIFITNNAVDLLVCLTLTPVLLSTTAGGAAVLFHFQGFCTFWNYFYAVCLRLSMFVMAMLCVSRTLSLVKPLYEIRIWHLVLGLGLYLIFLVVTRVVGVEKVVYDPGHMFCIAEYKADVKSNYARSLTDISKIMVPVVPSIAGCFITIFHLTRSKELQGAGVTTQQQRKREAIVTVVILTVIFLIVTIPHFILLIFQVICDFTNEETCIKLPTHFLHHLFCFYLPTLNSACNPLVYLLRIKKLRSYSLTILRCGVLERVEHDSKIDSKYDFDVNKLSSTSRKYCPPCEKIKLLMICRTSDVQRQ